MNSLCFLIPTFSSFCDWFYLIFEASSDDSSMWLNVYSGNATYYEDVGLTVFTTYLYRLTVLNDYYYSIGPFSNEVTTFGGVPLKPVNVTVTVLNFTAINVSWTLPSK